MKDANITLMENIYELEDSLSISTIERVLEQEAYDGLESLREVDYAQRGFYLGFKYAMQKVNRLLGEHSTNALRESEEQAYGILATLVSRTIE